MRGYIEDLVEIIIAVPAITCAALEAGSTVSIPSDLKPNLAIWTSAARYGQLFAVYPGRA